MEVKIKCEKQRVNESNKSLYTKILLNLYYRSAMNIFYKIYNFLCCLNKVESELHCIRKVWYITLLISSSIYVFKNFDTLVGQCFICKFDGNSLIFVLWLLLLIMPLVDSIEGYGFKFNKERARQEEMTNRIKKLGEDVVKQRNQPNLAELENKLKDTKKESIDEQL